MECRKLPFFGDCGETYFEQPSMNLILSGLWSCAHLRPRLVRVETVGDDNFFNAIRFTYQTDSARAAEGGKPMTLARLWLGQPKGSVCQTVNLLCDTGRIQSIKYSTAHKRIKHF
jgi:hypothetical protein